jgi:transglutaminase-like putative cysteine protease
MGHDGTMFLDANALLVPSSRIVMEVGFEGKIPPASSLYFRGSILYVDKQDHWEQLPTYPKRKAYYHIPSSLESITYNITLYPTQKKWLYMLDMPHIAITDTVLDRDLISTVKEDIKEPIHYQASSSLSPLYPTPLDKHIYQASTEFNSSRNPQVYEKSQEIKAEYKNIAHRATAIERFFKAQGLTYTLKPDALDTNRTSDSFLFDKRRGYCVHFASSFVSMARMAGIPSRIVTGYKSDGTDGIENYLAVREKDAHAWAELYIDGAWIRFESTATASFIDEESQALLNRNSHPMIKKMNLYLLYVKYQIETWILHYSHLRQLELLAYAKANPSFIVGFMTSIITLIILSFIMVSYFRRPRHSSKAVEILYPLLKALDKKNYQRLSHQSMHQFLLELIEKEKALHHLQKVDTLYQEIRYAQKHSTQDLQMLKKAVQESLKHLN